MELPLVYPIKDLSAVKVSIITMAHIQHLSNHQLLAGGDLPFVLLADSCPGVKPEQLKEISLIDSHRIMLNSWHLSYGSNRYIAKQTCECGALGIFDHNVSIQYSADPVYAKPHDLKAHNGECLTTYTVMLNPMSLQLVADSLVSEMEEQKDKIIDSLLYSRIKSINGTTAFNKIMPLALYTQIAALTDEDTKIITKLLTVESACLKCKKLNSHSISWLDAMFLQGK